MNYIKMSPLTGMVGYGGGGTGLTFNSSGLPKYSGDRALCHGGNSITNSYDDRIDYVSIATTNNWSDFGDLHVAVRGSASGFGYGRAVNGGGGSTGSGTGTYENQIQYHSVATTGDASDLGNLDVHRRECGCASDGLTIMWFAGQQAANDDYTKSTSWIDAATGSNATAGGNAANDERKGMGSVSNSLRAVYASGHTGSSYLGMMDYFTLGNRTGSGTDFGDLQDDKYAVGGAQDATRGLFAGGANGGFQNTIDFITVQTASNGTNFGDLQESRMNLGACGDHETGRAYFYGGQVPSSTSGHNNERSKTSEYVSVQTLANGTFGGDLTDWRQLHASCSGD